MALITYDDKVALNENASIPAKNKVSAEDMNEIKNAINNMSEYPSEEEVLIGTLDGEGLYKLTLTTPYLPNNKSVWIGTGFSQKNIKKICGVARDTVTGDAIPLPYFSTTSSECVTISYIGSNNTIKVTTYSDRSAWQMCLTIEYTKPTD